MNEIESYSFRVKQDMNDKKYEKVINEEGKKKSVSPFFLLNLISFVLL